MNDSSFEDVETQYTKDAAKRLFHRKHLLNRKSMPNLGTNSVSTISSDATAVVNQSTDIYWNQNDQNDRAMNPSHNKYHDFQSKQQYFDKMIQSHREDRSPTKRSNLFAHQVNNVVPHNKLSQEKQYLKHPKSMMDLHVRNQNNEIILNSNDKLKNSVSYHNLRQPTRSNSVRFKSSVTKLNNTGSTHISPIREYVDDEPNYGYDGYNQLLDKYNDTVIISRADKDEDFLNKFSDEKETIDDGFPDNNILKPHYLSTLSNHNRMKPLSFSKDDSNEDSNSIAREDSGRLRRNPMSRIKTIKQTIDSNNLDTISVKHYNNNNDVDDENIYYNPQTSQWIKNIDDNDDDLVHRFDEMNIHGKKRMNSKNKDQIYSLKNLKRRSHSRKPTIVNNMVLDEKNQRWVSISGDEPDPFVDIPDFPTSTIKQKNSSIFLRSHSSRQDEPLTRKITKNFPREYSSMNQKLIRSSSMWNFNSNNDNNITNKYFIDSYTLEKFYHEENKWNKMVGSWFVAGINKPDIMNKHDILTTNSTLTNQDRNSFMYEIRNMVMNSTRQ
ncbi:Bfa1p PWA37_003002 [Arxiozyma heterogenica]|uniref:Bfa1p n=1 Tax=Arxiozyma heterogenica TaxID=278026 RepID=UPI002EE65FC8